MSPKYTRQSCIYIIQNTKNAHVYIGQAQNVRERWTHHRSSLRLGKHGNSHLQRAWNKYGEKAFKFKILEYCTREQLDEREQHYLNIYIPKGICYNIAKDATAPNRGLKDSPETRQKKREAQLGKTLSEEHRFKISQAQKGRTISEEKKQHLREINTGKKRNLTNEQRKKMSDRMKGNTYGKGRHPNEETRQKLSDARKGEKNHHFGKKFSDEHRKRLSESHMNPSPEIRKKLSDSHKGQKAWNKGLSKKKPSPDLNSPVSAEGTTHGLVTPTDKPSR